MNVKKILVAFLLAGVLLMAISRVGTELVQNNSQTSSTSITVPADCTFVLLGLVFYDGHVDQPTYLRINGIDLTFINGRYNNDDSGYTALYRLSNPSTGSQTFSWSFPYAMSEGMHACLVYLKGVDLTSPIRDSDKGLSSPITLDTASGDYAEGVVYGWEAATNAAPTGSGQTEIITASRYPTAGCYAAVGEQVASGASTTFEFSGTSYPSATVCVLIPAAGGATYNEAPANSFSSTPSCTPSPQVDFAPSLGAFLSTPTVTPAVLADLLGSIGLASTPTLSPAAIADLFDAVTMLSTPTASMMGGMDFFGDLTFLSGPAVAMVHNLGIFPSLTLLSTPAFSASALADFLAVITLASTPAAVMAAIADFYLSLTLSSNPALSAVGGSDFYNSVAFSSGPALAAALYVDFFAGLTFGSSPVISVVALADLLGEILAASSPAFWATYGNDFIETIILVSGGTAIMASELISEPFGMRTVFTDAARPKIFEVAKRPRIMTDPARPKAFRVD